MQRRSSNTVLCVALATASLLLTSCGGDTFDGQKVKIRVEEKPVSLDGNQAMLNPQIVQCGVQAELWEDPYFQTPEVAYAHLLSAGRALGFDDDIVVAEPGFANPYVQIRGLFQVVVGEIPFIRDGQNGDKIANAKIGVVVNHSCFGSPLPLLGVKRGRFVADVNPELRFRFYNGRWNFDGLIH